MECLQSFKKEGVIDKIGIGGNPTASFYPYVVKENFDVLSGFLKVDACNLSGFKKDIPLIKKENIAYYGASALHMGLLGSRLKQYTKECPNNEWITNLDVDIALEINKIAIKHNIPLSRLALRYLFSMAEIDRVVVGPTKKEQIIDLIDAWEDGRLFETVFNEITNTIIHYNNINI